jgi:uncharacterized protein YqeY
MLKDNIHQMIADAMKNNDQDALKVYRLISAELTNAEKNGTKLDEATEAKILLKMATQRKDSIAIYAANNRNDLVESETKELDIITQLAPKQPTEDDVANATRAAITAYKLSKEDGYALTMKDMKPIMEIVKETYPTANGGIVRKILLETIS